MPGEEVRDNFIILECLQKIVSPFVVTHIGTSRSAYLEAWETGFEVLVCYAVKLVELLCSSAPTALVGGIVIIKIGLVPNFPILYIVMKTVCPAFGIVSDYMLTNNSPLVKILRWKCAVFFYAVFYF